MRDTTIRARLPRRMNGKVQEGKVMARCAIEKGRRRLNERQTATAKRVCRTDRNER